MAHVEYGRFENRHPFYRFGDGDEPLFVVPGLSDALRRGGPDRLTGELLARLFAAYTDDYEVWVVSRPEGLADGATTREMSGGYATVLDDVGSGAVVGLSMGGLIAQHLAADYPGLVSRLVLGISGGRLGERGRRILGRWRALAEAGQWGALAADTARRSYTGRRRVLAPPLVRLLGALGLTRPANPQDAVISCTACLDHDARDRLPEVTTPTLVVGGDQDELFPADVLREAAAALPDGRLELIRGAGHGVLEQRRAAFDSRVLAFLESTGSADAG
jgi:pimeloyl-ACP methyl ester carboxylesterase